MNIDFIAIDFETATSDHNSACAIGIAVVEDLRVAETFYSLIQPPGLLFHAGNIRVHGITPEMVADAPTLDEIWPKIRGYFSPHCPVAAHNAPFDVAVLRGSCTAVMPDFPYVDSIEMAASIVEGSRALAHCAEVLHIDLEHHHNALDDACACAEVAIAAIQRAGCLSMWEYLARNTHIKLRNLYSEPTAGRGPAPKPKAPKAAKPPAPQPDGPAPSTGQRRRRKPRTRVSSPKENETGIP